MKPLRDRAKKKMNIYFVIFEGNYCNFMIDHIDHLLSITFHIPN